MKITSVLQKRYPKNSDMYHKVESTKVCMLYNNSITSDIPVLADTQAISLVRGVLGVEVYSYADAHRLKLYEYDIIETLNQNIEDNTYLVERLEIRMKC